MIMHDLKLGLWRVSGGLHGLERMEWPARSRPESDRTSLGILAEGCCFKSSWSLQKQGLLCVWSSLPIPVSDNNKQHGKSMPPMHSS
ncbi:hypothetical protein TNCV_4865841 [Trichonephila clavipes]|nr:hypothetical protein TNCV_4865841 [Trichonephila clavipes]